MCKFSSVLNKTKNYGTEKYYKTMKLVNESNEIGTARHFKFPLFPQPQTDDSCLYSSFHSKEKWTTLEEYLLCPCSPSHRGRATKHSSVQMLEPSREGARPPTQKGGCQMGIMQRARSCSTGNVCGKLFTGKQWITTQLLLSI